MATRISLAAAGALLASAIGSPASAEMPVGSLPDGVSYVTSVEGIHEFTLDNELRVLLFPDATKPTITVNITYLVGSKHEGLGETGMAHLLEHLVFKGSTNHPNIPDELTAHGARPNGTTWVDRTNYFETFNATPENLEWALDLEADRMLNSFIAKEDLDSEMTVVRNEFERGESVPARVLEERVYSTAFLWHNYGKSTIGNRSDIENVPIDNLKAFYRRWYRPENAVLVVAGRLDLDETIGLVAETFGPLENPETPLPQTWTEEPPQDGERVVTLRRVGDVQVVAAAYHIPATAHESYPAVAILSHLLGDAPSGRLHRALVETNMAAAVRSNADRFAEPGLLYAQAEVRKEKSLEAAHDELLAVIHGVVNEPPTEREVERARAALLKDWERTFRNTEWIARRLTEWAAMGDWRMMFVHRDRLEQVTPEEVLAVAETYLVPENRTVGLYVPTEKPARAEVPSTPPVAELVEGYTGKEVLAMGEAFEATPENIEARVVRKTLPEGLELAMLTKKTRGAQVNVSLQLHFGDAENLRGKARIADITGEMLMRGTERHTREAISDELDRLGATVRLGGSATRATASIETTRENLVPVLELVAEMLRSPSFPQSELDQVIEQEVASWEDARNSPFRRAFNTLARHMDPWPRDDVRYTPLPDEALEMIRAVRREDVADFHESFYGASHGEMAIVGDFDAEAVGRRVEELFAGFESAAPYARLENPYRDRPAIVQSVETPDKETAVCAARLFMNIDDSHADYPALVLANYITGGGFLNSRITTRLRQKDGLSYGAGSRFSASTFDERASFNVFATYAPENDEKLLTGLREELEKIVDTGFTTEEVAEAKSGWLQQRQISRGVDRELAGLLTDRLYETRTFTWDAENEAAIAKLTPEMLHDAFTRHFDLSTLSIVRAGDFGYEKKEQASADEPETRPGAPSMR